MTDHWVGMYPKNGSQRTMTEIANVAPDSKGIVKRVRWCDLYDENNRVNLVDLTADAVHAKTLNKKLSVMVEDKTFDGTNPIPQHLKHYGIRTFQGYCAVRWNTTILDAMISTLLQIQKIPGVHSISLQETALGIDGTTLKAHGYTPQVYADMYIRIIWALQRAVPGKPVFWYHNYIAQDPKSVYAEQVLAEMLRLGNGRLGGPDWWPNNWGLKERSYPLYEKWHAKGLRTFITASKESYSQNTAYGFLSPAQLLALAQTTLKIDNMIWMYLKESTEDGGYNFFDAVPLMSTTGVDKEAARQATQMLEDTE